MNSSLVGDLSIGFSDSSLNSASPIHFPVLRERINIIDNPEERIGVAKDLAKTDAMSWKAHSKAQLAMRTSDYEPLYGNFISLRSKVEQTQFGIPERSATAAATWLATSAKYHDEAEEAFDNGDEARSIVEWENVKQALAARYLLTNINFYLSPKVVETLVTNIDGIKDHTVLFEIVKDELERSDQLDLYQHLLELSVQQAGFEFTQWETHHIKDYDGFGKATQSLLLLLGYKDENAKIGTNQLIEACQSHDSAESQTDQSQVSMHWGNAFNSLSKYYNTLLSNKVS
jgi:hypothetical protein